MKKVFEFLWPYIGAIYSPIYVLSWLLHKVARLILAISYFGMLDYTTGKDIIKYLFTWHGKH